MLISKKELLTETGISYGQLYRWKREGLIPESWFIKKPSFTGQETYFIKEKILGRIKVIQELKEKYSLEDLAKMLSPEVSEKVFTVNDLMIVDEISQGLIPCFCKAFDKNSFSYVELLIMVAVSIFYNDFQLQVLDVENICIGIKGFIRELKKTECICILLQHCGEYLVSIYDEKAEFYIDSRIKNLSKIRLNEISSDIKIKYRKSFNFRFDDAEDVKLCDLDDLGEALT